MKVWVAGLLLCAACAGGHSSPSTSAASPVRSASSAAERSRDLVAQVHVVLMGLSRPGGLPASTFTTQAADVGGRLSALATSLGSTPLASVLQSYASVASTLATGRTAGVAAQLHALDPRYAEDMRALGLQGLRPDQLVLPAATMPPPPDLAHH